MDLTAEVLVELLAALDTGAAAPIVPAPTERRAGPRVGVRYAIQIRPSAGAPSPADAGKPIRARLRDLSVDGVGITYAHPMAVGDSFVMVLPRSDAPPWELLCVVVSTVRAADGAYHLGAKFLAGLAEQELRDARRAAVMMTAGEPSSPACAGAAAAPVNARDRFSGQRGTARGRGRRGRSVATVG